MKIEQWQKRFGLEGKLAVVADIEKNASQEVATLLAEAGADIVIVDRNEASVAAIVESVRPTGSNVIGITANLEDEEEVVAVFERISGEIGSPDILVNCMAVNGNLPFSVFPAALWDDVQSINLRAVFLCMRECIKHMVAAGGGGRIINITTMGARHPVLHGNAAYAASRAGVSGLTRSAAYDFASQGIRVNEVLPGAIPGKVRFHETTQDALKAGYQLAGAGTDSENRILLGLGIPDDIAAAVLYLAGPSGSYLTGQAIVLDGGFFVS